MCPKLYASEPACVLPALLVPAGSCPPLHALYPCRTCTGRATRNMRLKLYAQLSLHVSEPQHQSLPTFLVTAGSLSLCTPQQPDCRAATGTRDRNIAEILEIAQLSFLAANRYPRNCEHGTVATPTYSDVSQSIQEPTVISIRICGQHPAPKVQYCFKSAPVRTWSSRKIYYLYQIPPSSSA